MKPLRFGVVGYGYWGPNLVRSFNETPGMTVTWVSDMQQGRLEQLLARYPNTRTTTDHRELLAAADVDAVAIATPVSTHFPIAKAALQAGKHVWVEKPLCATSEQAAALCAEADLQRRTLFVDHTFVYTGAVRKIRELLDAGKLGEIYYYDSVRVNLGLFQHDVNVIWDLAVHDVAIIDYLFPKPAIAVSATGMSHIPGQAENVAYITLFYPDRQLAHVNVNWLAPVKVRQTLIGGSERMIVYDDVEPSEKIKIYDKGVLVAAGSDLRREMMVNYRSGDMWAPRLDTTEALRVGASHFLECALAGKKPRTDGACGLRIVRTLEAIERSVRARGQLVELTQEALT
jgi:predicted dehydrogenase